LTVDPKANKWYQSESLSQFPKSEVMTDDLPILSSRFVAGKTSSGLGGNNGSGGSDQRVVREVAVGPVNWPLLTMMNYTELTLIIKIKLHVRNLWEAIESRDITL
jgi:hypothetical protein